MRTITIHLSAVKVRRLLVDADAQTVTVQYDLLDDAGSLYRHGEAVRSFAELPQGVPLQLRNLRDSLLSALRAELLDE